MNHRTAAGWLATVGCLAAPAVQDHSTIEGVPAQPLAAQARRVVQALELAGAPLDAPRAASLQLALEAASDDELVAAVQRALDPLCLGIVHVNPESRVKVARGPAVPELAQSGWRVFLVKVHNEAGVTSALRCQSPNAAEPFVVSSNESEPDARLGAAELRERWLDLDLPSGAPLEERLSGLALEYRPILLYSRDAGPREARLEFDVGQGTQDLGFRAELNVLFDCAPAVAVSLRIRDHDGKPTTARLTVRDCAGRVQPARSRRLEPDFFFHDQVYRADGEQLALTPGIHTLSWTRGPEYLVLEREIVVPHAPTHEVELVLERWIDLASQGWYSGDHHIHAAGCAHYDAPTQGVGPEAMMRHVLGEDLNVGCVLTWGPCWYLQKGFFEGEVHSLSSARHLLRYDVEVSGFPSSHAGHLCLLRLSEDDYPGAERIEDWPSWDLPVLRWARGQGAVVGFAHSGFGLEVEGDELPSHQVPAFDGIGANEYVVDVTHGAVDFISAVDTPAIWELNVWYHTLNAGYTTRVSGETDFPCIYGERVGLGRSWVRLDEGDPLSYDAWVRGLRDGRSYVGDGASHLVDFAVDGLPVGAPGVGGRASVLAARSGRKLAVRARVAALLPLEPDDELRSRPLDERPYWHLERARLGASRRVPLELVVNGLAVERREIEADGVQREVSFELEPEISSWVALRIFPSSHTNPIFVELDGQPVIPSRRSAEWCERAVETCWDSKHRRIRESELGAARAAYDFAAAAYRERAENAAGE